MPLEHHHVVRTWRPVCWGEAIAEQGWQGWSGLCEGAVGRGEGCFSECHSDNGPDDPPGILANWVEIRRGVPVVRGIRGMLTFEPDGDHVRAYGGSVRSWTAQCPRCAHFDNCGSQTKPRDRPCGNCPEDPADLKVEFLELNSWVEAESEREAAQIMSAARLRGLRPWIDPPTPGRAPIVRCTSHYLFGGEHLCPWPEYKVIVGRDQSSWTKTEARKVEAWARWIADFPAGSHPCPWLGEPCFAPEGTRPLACGCTTYGNF